MVLTVAECGRTRDKLLSKLEESEPDPPTSQEDECVICINARATMQTSPCGHRVVCRRCFVKTIQSAVAQRLLPLRCVICRARVNRLTSSSGTWRIQESASSYSMGAKSWASAGVGAGGVHASASSYSMGDAHSGHHVFHPHPALHGRYPRSPNGGGRVAQSDSLYSMSSTGSSSMSGVSHMSAYSKTSSISSGLCSPASPISPSAMSAYTQTPVLNNHLAPPGASNSHGALSLSPSGSASGSSVSGSLSPRDDHHHSHSHSGGCPAGCSGAIPRKPLNSLSTSSSSGSSISSCSSFPPATHTYPGRRHTKGRLTDLQNRLPPIKEFRSPAKVPHPSPVHISNPRFRYASYTKSSSSAHEIAPLLREPPSPPKRPMNILVGSASTNGLGPPPLKAGGSAKISPIVSKNSLPKNAYTLGSKDKKNVINSNISVAKANGKLTNATTNSNNNKKITHDANGNTISSAATITAKSTAAASQHSNNKAYSAPNSRSNSSSRSFPLFSNSNSNHKEKSDNKKNESMERKKKEEKLKLKAEKEARKEEKRLAKEEERLAKLIAKEEKKKGKKEAKELLIANDGNSKK
ncbi:PREDICTED: integrator complex subunit 6 homolog [Rhagoletis zephyria]|uniref:integrator complex subunit 6 homolog n=1 Tax=Rhagoletis zephyria TaxID=28612 RepID=UPI0008113944|nr:PREDICTED: integrator complex subunit 6 homolog [Rhagoletis zephyria]